MSEMIITLADTLRVAAAPAAQIGARRGSRGAFRALRRLDRGEKWMDFREANETTLRRIGSCVHEAATAGPEIIACDMVERLVATGRRSAQRSYILKLFHSARNYSSLYYSELHRTLTWKHIGALKQARPRG